jgi:integrase
MVPRYKPKLVIEPQATRPKAKANRKLFTEQNVLKLPVKPVQHFVWDAGTGAARGLAVLVNPTGTKTYFVNYRFPGSKRLHYMKLARVGDISVADARAQAIEARKLAFANKDPKAGDPNRSDSFEAVFETYIQEQQIGLKRNKSAMETRGVVLFNCAEFKPRAVATISYREVSKLLAGIRDGKDGSKPRASMAARVFSHLGDFFKWCVREEIIKTNPIAAMAKPAASAARDRFYSDDELRAIWHAADRLDPVAGCYVKLMMLLAVRRDELALAKWSEFDARDEPSLFTVPTERTKMKASAKLTKKPVYKVPLVPLAQRLVKGLHRDGELLFPGLKAGMLKDRLVKLEAPEDFMLHVFRHTTATWLQTAGRSEWEVGLVLNHSGSGSVTGGYSHGYPIELKRELLGQWAAHIEGLLAPAAVFHGCAESLLGG